MRFSEQYKNLQRHKKGRAAELGAPSVNAARLAGDVCTKCLRLDRTVSGYAHQESASRATMRRGAKKSAELELMVATPLRQKLRTQRHRGTSNYTSFARVALPVDL